MRRMIKRIWIAIKKSVQVGGSKYSVAPCYPNLLAEFAWSEQQYEVGMDDIFRRCLQRKSGAFVDVGANIGQTLVKVIQIDRDREYIGFEPQLSGAFLIDQFLAQNKMPHHFILPIGLSDRRSIEKLGINSSNDAAASFVSEYRPDGFYSAYIAIATMPGDDVLSALRLRAAVIKIDVEGAELEVIRGLSRTITKDRPFLLFEVLPHFLFRTRTELDDRTKAARDRRHSEIERTMKDHGYVLKRILPDRIEDVESIQADAKLKFDYLAVPSEELEGFSL